MLWGFLCANSVLITLFQMEQFIHHLLRGLEGYTCSLQIYAG